MIASHPAATMLLEYAAFIQVWYFDLKLHIYVSDNVWPKGLAYQPVRELIAKYKGRLLSETLLQDHTMMSGSARYLVYAADAPSTENEAIAA